MSTPNFLAPQTNPFNLADVGDYITPTFADLDNDGDLDAFVGESEGNIVYFKNTGSVGNPSFAAPVYNPFNLADVGIESKPAFADLDNDGDLDAFVGEWGGDIVYFKNTGSVGNPSFAAPANNPFNLADVGDYSNPTFADLDNDGDLDAFVGESEGNIVYFKNTGSVGNPSFAAPANNPFNLADVGDYSNPTFADLDNDGDLDAFVGEWRGDIFYFKNTGSVGSPSFDAAKTNPFNLTNVGDESKPTFADLDNDGDLDAFVGEWRGDIFYFENQPVTPNTPPTITSSDNPSVAENTTDAITVQATDPDGDNITYSISGGEDQALFGIDSLTGAVTFKVAPDFENPTDNSGDNNYQIEVTANDGTTGSTSQAITITVTDENETPTINSSNSANVAENTTDAITVQATDPDSNNITYSISGGEDQALFGIDTDTGLVTFKVAPDFENPTDNGGDNNYQIEVTANDGNADSTPEAITITVTDENETPTINSSNSANVAENTTNAITVQATDADGDNITYSISGGEDQALFGIDTDTGLVTFKVAPDFENPTDNGGDNNYQIEVTANDGTADSTSQAITITVTDENETPTMEGTTGSDRFRGTNNAENYSALDGHDRVYGYGGADNLDGGDGNDIVYGGNDDDILSGGVGHDRLNGDNGNDLLLGNDGNDILNGGAGDDTLNGGAGSDRYVGGAGADTFIIGLGLGVDLIQRFEDSTDIIELEGIDFADLDIVKSGSSTLIKVAATGEALASLSGIDVGLVGADDFSQSVI